MILQMAMSSQKTLRLKTLQLESIFSSSVSLEFEFGIGLD